MRVWVLSLGIVGILAIAGHHAAEASPPSEVADEPAIASSKSEGSTSRQALAGSKTASKEEFRPPEGFKKRMRNGKEVYCRKVAPAGSRIERTECFTEAQVAAIEEAQRAFRDDLRNQGLICADQRCNGT